MGENIGKWCNWEELNLQNIQAAHATQQQKTNNPVKNGQKTLIDISVKKEGIHMISGHTRQDWLLEKCKSEL